MNIHVICPFYRKHLAQVHIKYFTDARVYFHPVCDSNDITAFDGCNSEFVKPFLCDPLKIPGDQAYKKINDYIDAGEIIDGDLYGFMGDDDSFEPCFFNVIRTQTAKIIFVSLSRGNLIPPGAHPHPTTPLIVSKLADIRLYNVGLCQYFMRGEILKQMRFNNQFNYDDGLFAVELKNRFASEIIFIPDLFAFGNYYEPGRYSNDTWKIKPHWQLPGAAV
jgi:hypothetical protein